MLRLCGQQDERDTLVRGGGPNPGPGAPPPRHRPARSPAPHQLISHAGQGLGGAEAHRVATGQRRGRQAPLAGAATVVGDAEGTALVVVQSAACGGRQTIRDVLPPVPGSNAPPPPFPFLWIRNRADLSREGPRGVP